MAGHVAHYQIEATADGGDADEIPAEGALHRLVQRTHTYPRHLGDVHAGEALGEAVGKHVTMGRPLQISLSQVLDGRHGVGHALEAAAQSKRGDHGDHAHHQERVGGREPSFGGLSCADYGQTDEEQRAQGVLGGQGAPLLGRTSLVLEPTGALPGGSGSAQPLRCAAQVAQRDDR